MTSIILIEILYFIENIKRFSFILFLGIAFYLFIPSFTQKVIAALLFSDPMTNGINQTYWNIQTQYFTNTPTGIQDNGTGNYLYSQINSQNINFQNDNTVQVTLQIGSKPSDTGIVCRRAPVSSTQTGDLVEIGYHPDGTGFILFRYLNNTDTYYYFNWNKSPGTHVLAASCIGPTVTVYEDGIALKNQTFTDTIYGDYYQLAFGGVVGGNSIYSNWQYCNRLGCASPNQAPIIGQISAPSAPNPVNTSITASATFTDSGITDTHTSSWDWGDGSVTAGTVIESNGSGSVQDSHIYINAGVYTLTLTVIDDKGASSSAKFQYVVIYDQSAGFLTVGGQYDSQAGWDLQNLQASGTVPIGVSAKYVAGNNTPTGSSKINFIAGNLGFVSTSYNWLVVSGAKAILEGNGTINGTGNYNFFISAIDGSQTGGQNLIRVRITDQSNNVIYDTQNGADENTDPTTPLNHGAIKVH